MSMLNKIKTRLQTEAETHSETTRQLETLQLQLCELQQMVGNSSEKYIVMRINTLCASNNIDTCIGMKLAKRMTRVYLIGVLLSLAHFHLVRTMKCGLYTQGQVSDAAQTRPL